MEGATGILNSEVVTFVVDGAKAVIEIMTTPPLGLFITIGLIGSVVGVVGGIVKMVRRH